METIVNCMRLSSTAFATYKDSPKEAEFSSHKLLLRAGLIHQYVSGVFGFFPFGAKVIEKIIRIVNEEMEGVGGQRIMMTSLAAKELWQETERYEKIDKSMFRFKDRHDQDLVLNMTHEEPVVDMLRHITKSYRQLPFMVYQIQTKFRDEPRPRGGLIRLREFLMKDGYSFHLTEEEMLSYYWKVVDAYDRCFKRIGFRNFIKVESDNGMFGGQFSHEFMLLTPAGEDTLVVCESCDYKANLETATANYKKPAASQTALPEKVQTPGVKKIPELAELLSSSPSNIIKTVFYETLDDKKLVVVFVRGDLDVVITKLQVLLQAKVSEAKLDTIINNGFVPGYAGPLGLNFDELSQRRVTLVLDSSLESIDAAHCGANEIDYHYKFVSVERDILKGAQAKSYFLIASVATVKEGDLCPKCGAPKLILSRGIEIGNTFHLGQKYSKAMNFVVSLPDGKNVNPVMGCYGLGLTRAFGSIVEENNDSDGIIFPITVAPFEIHLMAIKYSNPEIKQLADSIFDGLKAKGYEVLFDDRDANAGVQFKDADLLGIPLRVLVSPKLHANGQVEVSWRDRRASAQLLSATELQAYITSSLTQEYAKYEMKVARY